MEHKDTLVLVLVELLDGRLDGRTIQFDMPDVVEIKTEPYQPEYIRPLRKDQTLDIWIILNQVGDVTHNAVNLATVSIPDYCPTNRLWD